MNGLQQPLTGVRVLDLTHFLAGPYATWILAELGADVIKVEDPEHPDEARTVGPYFQERQSLYFAALNGGKRSIALSLRSQKDRETLDGLVHTSDVLVSNSRPGVMAKIGLAPEELRQKNSRLISCSITGFGETGPYVSRPGYDYTIQALTGVMSMTGEPGGPPAKAGISYVDHTGGLGAALAVCAALVARARTGQGGHLDLALLDLQVSMLTYLAAWNLNTGYPGERSPSGSHPSIVPAQNFATADGYISVFVGNDGIWQRFLDVFPDDSFLRSPRFRTGKGRRENRSVLVDRIGPRLRSRTSAEWVETFNKHRVPCARVNDLSEAMQDEQILARGLVRESTSRTYGTYRHVSGPFPMLGQAHRPAPDLGEHSAEIREEVARLMEVTTQ